MNIDQAGLDFIIKWEWVIPFLYNDPLNATVGVGHLIHEGVYHEQRGVCALCDAWPRKREAGQWLTAQQADDLLREDVQRYADTVNAVTPGLSQPRFNAMVDLCFNIGRGGYARSPVVTAIRNGENICPALQTHIYDGNGQALNILKLRRADECRLFYSEGEEDEMWHRLNGLATWWTGRNFSPVADGTIELSADFPALPASAKAVDLEVFLHPNAAGKFVLKDGDGNYAGQFNASRSQGVVRVVPVSRKARFAIEGGVVQIDLLGVVGYLE